MSLHKINPTKTKAWKKLVEQKDILTTETLNSLFAKEKNRLDYLSIKWDCFDIDFSKNILDEKTFSFLTDLAEECKIEDSIKMLFNQEIISSKSLSSGAPGLYNGNTGSADYNPLGWYSFKVVIKQTQQEYYNVYTAGILNGPPNGVTATNDTAGEDGFVSLFSDNINKIPRDPTAVIPPSTSATISPCDISVYPKYLNGGNVYTADYAGLTSVQSIANPSGDALVTTIDNNGAAVNSGLCVFETEPISSELDIFFETSTGGLVSEIPATAIDISFFNCILLTFDPGGVGDDHIEINRIRAGFNEPAFNVGVRAYVVQENFTEERRGNTLIHSSGLLNSRTGINYINQFNEAEGGLTISLDPQDGSVQKLFTDDTSINCLLYTSPSPRDLSTSRMPSSA